MESGLGRKFIIALVIIVFVFVVAWMSYTFTARQHCASAYGYNTRAYFNCIRGDGK
jgi:hypothetical protein